MAHIRLLLHKCNVAETAETYLRPGTWVASDPSRRTQDTRGGGLPWAVQVTWAPVSLPKSSRGAGSSRNVGTRKPLVAKRGVARTASSNAPKSSAKKGGRLITNIVAI